MSAMDVTLPGDGTTQIPPTLMMKWRRRVWRVGRSALLMYLMVVLVFSVLQTKLIFPGASSQGKPESVVTPPQDAELLELRAATGEKVAALFGRALLPSGFIDPESAHRPEPLLYFYGNAMNLSDAALDLRDFRRLGFNVIIAEYLGYGMSGGEAGEQGCYAAAEATYQHLLTRADIDTKKIIPTGWSLGGAVAAEITLRHQAEGHIAGLILFSSFTSMAELAQHHYPVAPVKLVLKHAFETERKLHNLRVPVLIGHGRRDSIVPSKMSGRLAAAATAAGVKVTRFVIEEADHNDFFAVGEERVFGAMQAFARVVMGFTTESTEGTETTT